MEKKKANTNVKTTMDFFKQKRAKANNKKLFSHIEINSNTKASTTTSSEFNSTIQGVIKSDIFQVDTYLNKIQQILMYFSETRENLLLYNKDFNKKINLIKENLKKDTKESLATNRINSLNINYLYNEYKCNDKETLISDMAYENFTLKLLLDKLDDLFFLINLKIFDSQNKFSKNYKNNLSKIVNIKYFCETITTMNDTIKFETTDKFKSSFNMNEIESLEKGLLPISHQNSKNLEKAIKEEVEQKEKENEEKSISETKTSNNESKMGTTKKSMEGPSITFEPKEIPIDIVNDVLNKINEMKKFGDFLNLDYDQDEFIREIFEKIRELFYVYNKHMFDPIVDLINTKFQVKSDLSNKVQIVLKNEVNDCYENVILIRKVLEDNFKENEKKMEELIKEKKIYEKKYNELETKFNKQQKTLEEIGNRDYSNYYKQMKESNEQFLKDFEKLEKQRNEKLYEQYEKQLEKNKLLKKEIKEKSSEIFALKKKIDNINAIKDKSGDDYVTALQEQFEDAKDSFQEEISNITDEFYKKRKEWQQKIYSLENENKRLKGIQSAIMKKLDTMESLFSK